MTYFDYIRSHLMVVWMNGTNPEGKPHKNDQNKEAQTKNNLSTYTNCWI